MHYGIHLYLIRLKKLYFSHKQKHFHLFFYEFNHENAQVFLEYDIPLIDLDSNKEQNFISWNDNY